MATTGTRQTAEERRAAVLEAAAVEFALAGLAGTSTDDIARRAGISQPYLFRLFRTKKELFLAAIDDCFDRTTQLFQDAAAEVPQEQRLESMGLAYCELLRDRTRLMMQMQSYAACNDSEVRELVRQRYGALMRFVEDVSGADAEQVRAWFATGMLLNVAAAMDLSSLNEDWPKRLLGEMLEKW
jgi:AcrR family transcriptional regulator